LSEQSFVHDLGGTPQPPYERHQLYRQSVSSAHVAFAALHGAQAPPQSTSVSFASTTPLSHVSAATKHGTFDGALTPTYPSAHAPHTPATGHVARLSGLHATIAEQLGALSTLDDATMP